MLALGSRLRTEAGGWRLPTSDLGKALGCPMEGRQTTARPCIYPDWPAPQCTPIPSLTPGVPKCQGNCPPPTYRKINTRPLKSPQGELGWRPRADLGRGQEGMGCPQPGVWEHSCHWPVLSEVSAHMDGWEGAERDHRIGRSSITGSSPEKAEFEPRIEAQRMSPTTPFPGKSRKLWENRG